MKVEPGLFKSSLARYVISIFGAVAALLLYQALVKLVGGDLPTYILFYPAVIITSLFAGIGAGLLTTATAALLAAYWILPPEGFAVSFLPNIVGLVIFLISGSFISVLAELYRRARQKAADYAAEMALREEQKKIEEILQKNDVRLHMAQDAAKAGAWEWDMKTNENVWSEELWKLFGLEPHCCKPSYETWQQTVHPDDREKIVQVVQEAIAKGLELNVEWRVQDPDGSMRWLMSRGKLVHDIEGRPGRYIGIVMDITERKRMEEALKERSDHLEAINEELNSFTSFVSHDLRAPLRAIDGYVRMISRRQEDKFDEETRRQFNLIRNNVRSMGKLIEDLLAFAQLGRQAMTLSRIDMESLVREVWGELQEANPGRRINLKMGLVPPVMGDQALIKQVLKNILENAFKFTRVRETALIEAGGSAKEHEIVYYIRDNGIGLEMSHHGKLFGVFQRLQSADEYEGTGIGLALVQRIINRHGGRVWAEGEVGKGATFYFTLPASMEEASDKNQS